MEDRKKGFEELLSIVKNEDIRLWVDNGILNCEAVEGVITDELQQSIKEYKEELIEMLEKEQRKLDLPYQRLDLPYPKLDLPYQKEPEKAREHIKTRASKAAKPSRNIYNLNQGAFISLVLKIISWFFLLAGFAAGIYYIMVNGIEIGLLIIFVTLLLFAFFLTFGAMATNIIDIKRMMAKQIKPPEDTAT